VVYLIGKRSKTLRMRPYPLLMSLPVLAVLAACSDAPLCRYWTDAPIGKGVLDPSQAPMLPYNPYWTGAASRGAPAANDPCAGEPGHAAAAAS
jgi:hypothetical protein